VTNRLTYRGYTASMTFDADDKIIVGRVVDLDDIITFHGPSVEAFEQTFHRVVDDYIAACRKLGSVPEKPASGKLMLRIAPDIHAAALKAAARNGVSLNKWAEQALRAASRKRTSNRAAGSSPKPVGTRKTAGSGLRSQRTS
jgi:predicted HicB family RNase H-like nuclease